MADRETAEQGALTIEVEGEPYTLVFDLNAMASLEDVFTTPDRDGIFDEIIQKCARGSVRHTRALVWAALHRHHPSMTVEDAGRWIVKAGGLQAVTDQLMVAAGMSTPDAADVALVTRPQGKGTRPRKARAGVVAGTIGSSTSSPATSA